METEAARCEVLGEGTDKDAVRREEAAVESEVVGIRAVEASAGGVKRSAGVVKGSLGDEKGPVGVVKASVETALVTLGRSARPTVPVDSVSKGRH
jgi:hypothetical protein